MEDRYITILALVVFSTACVFYDISKGKEGDSAPAVLFANLGALFVGIVVPVVKAIWNLIFG